MGALEFWAIEFHRDSRWSLGSDYSLRFTETGNLELWKTVEGQLVWETNTRGYRLAMQADGNLVVYAAGGEPLWESKTAGNNDAVLVATDSGTLEIFTADRKRALWQAKPTEELDTPLVEESDKAPEEELDEASAEATNSGPRLASS